MKPYSIVLTSFLFLSLNMSGMYNSPLASTSNGLYSTDAYFTLDFRATIHILTSLSIRASVSNLFDASYSYVEGYPAPGRQFFLGFRYDLDAKGNSLNRN